MRNVVTWVVWVCLSGLVSVGWGQEGAPIGVAEVSPPQGASDRIRAALGAPPAALLGMSRAAVDATLHATGSDADWVLYGADLALRYRDGVVSELRVHVVAETCEDAALKLGYDQAEPPLRALQSCAWPGIRERHRLARGVGAELTFADAVFHVWNTAGP